ncbi:MAG: type II secretion system protein [Patescibacteria group bacterium]|nr:type II secretion system protein [Patescibacteria group bacterium]
MIKCFSKKKKIGNNGFSLIEILVSLSIFSIIIGSMVLFSVRTIEAHTKSQAMQNAIDNARFAIEILNKKVRVSHDVNDNDGNASQFGLSDEIFFVDNLDDSKYCYKFLADKLVVSKVPENDSAARCSDFSNFKDIVGGGGKIKIGGKFYVKQTDTGNRKRGFVRTVVQITYNDTTLMVAEKDSAIIQSGVSLRDY